MTTYGTTSVKTTSHSIGCTNKAIRASAARRARARCNPAKTAARVGGGGKIQRPRSAGCTSGVRDPEPFAARSEIIMTSLTRSHGHWRWLLDIGLLGRSLFVSEARRELESGKGILWEIDPQERIPMSYFPIYLEMTGRRSLVIGGGAVA